MEGFILIDYINIMKNFEFIGAETSTNGRIPVEFSASGEKSDTRTRLEMVIREVLNPFSKLGDNCISTLEEMGGIPPLSINQISGFVGDPRTIRESIGGCVSIGDRAFKMRLHSTWVWDPKKINFRTSTGQKRVIPLAERTSDDLICVDSNNGTTSVKRLIRQAVQGDKDSSKLQDEVLDRLIAQDRANAGTIFFSPIESLEDKAKHKTTSRKSIRNGQSFIQHEEQELHAFDPTNIVFLENGEVDSKVSTNIETSFSEAIELLGKTDIFPRSNNINELLTFIGSSTNSERSVANLLEKILEAKENNKPLELTTWGLPCINPNPLVTDHRMEGVNFATAIFLLRLQHIASEIERLTGVSTSVSIIRELEHLKGVFDLSDELITRQTQTIDSLVSHLQCNKVKVVGIPGCQGGQLSCDDTESIQMFKDTFLKSIAPRNQNETVMLMILNGNVNHEQAIKLLKRFKISDEEFETFTNNCNTVATRQAIEWGKVRTHLNNAETSQSSDVQQVSVSLRVGSKRFVLNALTDKTSGNRPSLPQHCSLGVTDTGEVITGRRIDFLLHPNDWVEIGTEIGAFFVSKDLI